MATGELSRVSQAARGRAIEIARGPSIYQKLAELLPRIEANDVQIEHIINCVGECLPWVTEVHGEAGLSSR